MLSLSNYFAKFKSIEKGKSEIVLEVIHSVQTLCNFTLTSSEVLVDNGVARILTSPLKRNEIFMRKEEILSNLALLNSSIIEIK